MIIPASEEYNVPGADDAAIQADILATLGRDTGMVRAALDHLARLAGKPLARLDSAKRDAVAREFRATGGRRQLVRVVLQCYCHDDPRLASRWAMSSARRFRRLYAGAGRLVVARSRQGAAAVVAARA